MELSLIIIGVILLVILICLIGGIVLHNKIFNHRFDLDGIIKYYTVEEYDGLKADKVEFKVDKNILRGYFYHYDCEYKAVIIFAHGMWSSHKAYLQEIALLAQNGYLVLGFDYVGTDLSDGKSLKGFTNSVESLDHAIKFVKNLNMNLDIYVMGHSWGGYTSLAITKFHPDIKKVVSMAPFISVKQLLKYMVPKYLRFIAYFIWFIDYLQCRKYAKINLLRDLNDYHGQALIIHSKDDSMVNYNSHTKKLEDIFSNKFDFLIVDNKNHNPDYTLEAINYTKSVFSKMKEIPKAEVVNYRKSLDYHKMGEIDLEVFNVILNFFNDGELEDE